MNAPNDAPKKGMSTLKIVLIIGGVLFLLAIGTCAAAGLWVGSKVKEVKQNIADGGLVLVSPAEVVTELAGPKKDYVGVWTSASGKSTLDINSTGNLSLVEDERGSKQTLTAPIAAFVGDDMEIRVGLTFKLPVTETPHQVGSGWEMTVKGIKFRRN